MWAVVIHKSTNLYERNSDSLRTQFPEVNEISLDIICPQQQLTIFNGLPVTVIYLLN